MRSRSANFATCPTRADLTSTGEEPLPPLPVGRFFGLDARADDAERDFSIADIA
jgi:hypothetical protein